MRQKVKRVFDPGSLFDSGRFVDRLAPYRSLTAELDAVAAGKKAISRFSSSLEYIENHDDFRQLLEMAFERGLAVVLDDFFKLKGRDRAVTLYVLPLEQAWRISALKVLHNATTATGGSSFSTMAQESELLGYSPKQRSAWLAAMRHARPALACFTIYALLTREQRNDVVALGNRCFGAPSAVEGIEFFFHRNHDELAKNAFTLVPTGLTLARVGLEVKTFHALFGPWKTIKSRGLITATASKRLAPRINASLRSNVELLTRDGWK